jgi:hypothetical protein
MIVTGASGCLLCRADSPLQSASSYRSLIAHAIRWAYVENGVARSVQVLVPIEFSMGQRLARAES